MKEKISMDNTIISYIKPIERMAKRQRINLRSLEQQIECLIDYLREIINSKDISKAKKAKQTLATYSDIFCECRRQRLDFMIRKVDDYISRLDEILNNINDLNMIESTIFLDNANWSIKKEIIGKIVLISYHDSYNLDSNMFSLLRNGYSGLIIYLMPKSTKPSSKDILNWFDTNSCIVSDSGGRNSEEMNAARDKNLNYINGASIYYERLRELNGKIVRLLPESDKEQVQQLIHNIPESDEEQVQRLIHKISSHNNLHPAIKEFNNIILDTKNKLMAFCILIWSVNGSKSGEIIREQLKEVIQTPEYKYYIAEGRNIPSKDYQENGKISNVAIQIRALARFASARERKDYRYASKIVDIFSNISIVELLRNVLSEDQMGEVT